MTNLLNEKDDEVFKQVSNVADELRTNVTKNTTFKPLDWYSERLNVLTGAFMYISTRFSELHAARRNNETSAYIKARNDASVAGGKFVSAIGEREAHHAVADFYEAEKIIEGYRDAANQGILTLKKNMEVLITELQREAR